MDTAWFLSQLDRAGLSQADLARHLRLAPSAVSRMLKGDRQMKLLEAAQTASFLGVSQDEVLRRASGEGPPGTPPEGPRRPIRHAEGVGTARTSTARPTTAPS